MKISLTSLAALASCLLLGATLTSCSSAGDTASAPPESSAAGSELPELSGTLTVFAAASLKSTFTELATAFEAAHPQAHVSLNFDGSSTLVTQITQGAPADVFASADTATMTKLSDAKLAAGTPVDFASNVLTLVVPPSNPANIASFADASKAGTKLVICAPKVPCGAAAQSDATAAGLSLKPVSEELSVTSVLGKVTSGEADAGLVYVTDARAAKDKVKTIPLGLASPTVNEYPIAAVSTSPHPDLANAFIALVTAPEGQKVLQDAGFGTP
ncbi:molybdate ABC transporter substrate-binding protein [Arthrobacter psychrolactophilus]